MGDDYGARSSGDARGAPTSCASCSNLKIHSSSTLGPILVRLRSFDAELFEDSIGVVEHIVMITNQRTVK